MQEYVSAFTLNVKKGLYHYFDFYGRSGRAEFWYFLLLLILLDIIFGVLFAFVDKPTPFQLISPYNSLYGATMSIKNLFLIPFSAVMIRRLHDVGRSGWWILLIFTFIGIPVLIYWLIKSGDEQENQYGFKPSQSVDLYWEKDFVQKVINHSILYTKYCFSNAFNYDGRATRMEFGYFVMVGMLLGVGFSLLSFLLPSLSSIFFGLNVVFGIVWFFPQLACMIRRLHDTDRTAWWLMIWFTVVGGILLMFWMLSKTGTEKNRYGEPKNETF